MINNGVSADKHIYGAVNSAEGFISYFDRILKVKEPKKTFILKGGPGTGKSTLMKRILSECEGDYKTAIWCSSDPKSLDGAILERGKNTIAILDGTAPHAMEASSPGCYDEIVDLGVSFNTDTLERNSDKIIALSSIKSSNYQKAYLFLEIWGKIFEWQQRLFLDSDFTEEAASKADELIKLFKHKNGAIANTEIISSFSKYGYLSIEEQKCQNPTIYIDNECGYGYFVLEIIREKLVRNGLNITLHPFPLYPKLCEAISTSECTYSVSKSNTGSKAEDANHIKKMQDALDSLLIVAEKSLQLASEAHFSIEKIYKEAVDFAVVDKITDRLITRIDSYLS